MVQAFRGCSLSKEALSTLKYIDCTFTNCTIEYGGKAVILQRTTLKSCDFVFSEEAKMTLAFLDCVGILSLSDFWMQSQECLVH